MVGAALADARLDARLDLDGDRLRRGPRIVHRHSHRLRRRAGSRVRRRSARVLGVPTLEAIARRRMATTDGRVACLDARMREVYVAAYARDGGSWREVAAPAVLAPAGVELPAAAFPPAGWTGAGNGFAAYPGPRARGSASRRAHAAARPDGARRSASSRCRAWLPAMRLPAAEALPLYVRHRVALTTAERAAGAVL